jgi:hypothetical protein
VKARANCRLIGRWRIVEADLWDRAHLDLCGPARLTITAQEGEIAFGALEAGLEVEYARDSIGFHWPAARKAMRSRAKGPPSSSTTASSRSSSHTETATKPSSKPNGILLQQPASQKLQRLRMRERALCILWIPLLRILRIPLATQATAYPPTTRLSAMRQGKKPPKDMSTRNTTPRDEQHHAARTCYRNIEGSRNSWHWGSSERARPGTNEPRGLRIWPTSALETQH